MGPLFSIIFAAFFGSIFLTAGLIYGLRTRNWYPLKVVVLAGGILGLLATVGIGSQVIFSLKLTRNKPEKSALVGTWRQDEYASYPTKIKLQADGNVSLDDSQEPTNGKWKLTKVGSVWEVNILSYSQMQFGLIGRIPPYKLYSYVGDPDSGKMVIYTKIE